MFRRIASEWAYFNGCTRALRRTYTIARHPTRTVRDLFETQARDYGERLALDSDHERLTHQELNARANQYARWARATGLRKGDVVGLLMPNRPEYVAIWVGLAKMGGVSALLNTHLAGASLAQCIDGARMKAIIVDARLRDAFEAARPLMQAPPRVFVHGEGQTGETPEAPRLDKMLAGFSGADIPASERPPLTIEDRCLYVYTSGTTGLPKAANLNHYRTQLAMFGFAGVIGARRDDRVYLALPMYHSTGGIGAIGAALSAGGSCYIRESFSAREFWSDIVRQDCTAFFYVGELCRILLATPRGPFDRKHRLRLCVGNGLRPDIFAKFRERFGLKKIVEFYAATEGNITLFNFDCTPGAVGRIPKWLERKLVVKIVRFDIGQERPVRGADGRCIECGPDEVGEALGRIIDDPSKPTGRFEGYADADASQAKILRDVFAPGDAWFRSGDLLSKDKRGYFSFVDRVGDTFRWKGENVSTTQVAEAMTTFPGVTQACVYGVKVPGADGRAGMAALVVEDRSRFDFGAFHTHLATHLPPCARPLFLRFCERLDMTATFRQRKTALAAEGFDPTRSADPIVVADPAAKTFAPLDSERYRALGEGGFRF